MKNNKLFHVLVLVLSLIVSSCSEKEPLHIPVTGITLNPTSVSLVEGETTTVSATISPSNADNQKVIWSSDNSSVATVNNGTITAVSAGTATITAKADDGGKTATCSVSVKSKSVPVESVSLEKTAITLRVGGTAEVKATISPDNATNKTINWKSSDESIASVKDGVITGVGLGTCSITATVEGKTATCTITVEATPVESITLDVDKAEVMEGKTIQLSATVLPEDATDKTIVWSSSDESVAKVSGDGLVSAISVGQATITAVSGEKSASCLISVSPAPTPLTFTAVGNSTIALKAKGSPCSIQLNYRKGAGEWAPYEVGQAIQLSDGESISFHRVGSGPLASSTSDYHFFMMTGQMSASGNISSLVDEDIKPDSYVYFPRLFKDCSSLLTAPELPATTLANHCYYYMFDHCSSLVEAPELPATTLAEGCYQGMFDHCNALVEAPELPATTLARHCYSHMFNHCYRLAEAPELPATILASACYSYMFGYCSSLVKAPELPATTLADGCYLGMFSYCTNIKNAPELPASTLDYGCYYYMFEHCNSLVKVPALPATTLADYCYSFMFSYCSSLVKAPELPATTLTEGCYQRMFLACYNLVKAPELPATALADDCYDSMFCSCNSLSYVKASFTSVLSPAMMKSWLTGVAPNGTFVRSPEATWTREEAQIPSGWTIVDAE